MNLHETMKSISRLGIDSAPLIYLVEKHSTYFDQMLFIIQQIHKGSITAISSTLTIIEVLIHPIRQSNTHLINEYRDILENSKGFDLVSLQPTVAHIAADLRAKYNLKTPDAIHVASAIHMDCDAFLTNDEGIKRVTEIPILLLDELKIESD